MVVSKGLEAERDANEGVGEGGHGHVYCTCRLIWLLWAEDCVLSRVVLSVVSERARWDGWKRATAARAETRRLKISLKIRNGK